MMPLSYLASLATHLLVPSPTKIVQIVKEQICPQRFFIRQHFVLCFIFLLFLVLLSPKIGKKIVGYCCRPDEQAAWVNVSFITHLFVIYLFAYIWYIYVRTLLIEIFMTHTVHKYMYTCLCWLETKDETVYPIKNKLYKAFFFCCKQVLPTWISEWYGDFLAATTGGLNPCPLVFMTRDSTALLPSPLYKTECTTPR